MSQYYLVSQLPSLDGADENTQLPITEEHFYELCSSFLGKRALNVLNKLELIPERVLKKTGYSVVDKWNDGERNLRLALAGTRASRINKAFDAGNEAFSVQVLQAARTALEMDDPMEAEKFLNQFRLTFLETLRPMDAFCDDAIFYYGLKLKLILRIQQFEQAKGQAAYRRIYDSIINGEDREV